MSFKSDDSFAGTQGVESDESCAFSSIHSSLAERGQDELVIDRAITSLTKCLEHYETRVRESEHELEHFGFSIENLPEDIKSDLLEAFADEDGVFNFPRGGSELVQINPAHVLNSLQQKYELEQLRMLSSQMTTLIEEYSQLENNLERKLNSEIEETEKLENKRCDKEASLIIFNQKLEAAVWELKNLQKLSNDYQKPRYELDEMENFKQDLNKLQEDIGVINAKLNKYNSLPLSEKDAQRQVLKIKEDLKKIDIEIRNILESI